MNKIFTFLTAATLFCAAMPTMAQTTFTDETTGRAYHFDFQILGGDSAKIVHNESYASLPASILIPTTVKEGSNTYRVVEIGEGAFANCTNLVEPELGHNSDGSPYWKLDKKAFANCPNITWLDFYVMNQIGDSAFAGCTNLDFDSGSWDDFVTIGANAFENCTKWASVIIGKSVTSLGDCAFKGCTNITDIYMYSDSLINGASTLDKRPFKGLENNIQSIQLYEGVKYIPLGMFYGMKNAEIEFNCPSAKGMYQLKDIGKYAFASCTQLTSGMMEKLFTEALTCVGTGAFEECTGISSLTLPSKLSQIENYAFAGLEALSTINATRPLPPTINANVFSNCNDNLKNIALYVADSTYTAYNTANVWKDFNVQPSSGFCMLNLEIEHGSVKVLDATTEEELDPTKIVKNTEVKFAVTCDEGYYEGNWEYKGKTLTVTKNQSLMVTVNERGAIIHIYKSGSGTITAKKNGADITLGYHEFNGYYNDASAKYFDSYELTAVPAEGYVFARWADGPYDNPRTIVMNQDNATSSAAPWVQIDLTAYFVSATGLENVQSDNVQCTKLIRDGQLYIMYNGKMYNVQGIRIK